MTTVFVSSTFSDLQSHREAVRAGIRKLGANDISMENFGARDERPKDECLKLVRDSDIFVGIYAHRYGYIPDGEEISITQAEYDAATLANVPRFIYLIDDDHPWRAKLIDEGEKKLKLNQLKEFLLKRHMCQRFLGEDNLAASVVADLGRHLAMRNATRVQRAVNVPDIGMESIPEIGMSSSFQPANQIANDWSTRRKASKANSRNVFVVHVIEPTQKANQLFDVYIYLARQGSTDFTDVRHAEFFLGRYWGNHVFKAVEKNGFIGIATAAYGTFLCICKVTFTDGHEAYLDRYIDFESQRHGR